MFPPRVPRISRALHGALLLTFAAGLSACSISQSSSTTSVSTGASATTQAGGQPAGGVAGGDHAHHHHVPDAPPIRVPPGARYTEADVRFMQGMIAHHAQAIHMSRMAPSRGGNPRLVRFAQKIDQSQEGEIVLMQDWLRAHDQFAPDTSSWRTMQMPGMVSAKDLELLAASRGAEFDRMFLQLMIRHHEGAIQMVKELFAVPRSGQEVDINVFANEVEQVQTTEIEIMRGMLHEMGS